MKNEFLEQGDVNFIPESLNDDSIGVYNETEDVKEEKPDWYDF